MIAGDEGASQGGRYENSTLGLYKYLKEGTARPMRLSWNQPEEEDGRHTQSRGQADRNL